MAWVSRSRPARRHTASPYLDAAGHALADVEIDAWGGQNAQSRFDPAPGRGKRGRGQGVCHRGPFGSRKEEAKPVPHFLHVKVRGECVKSAAGRQKLTQRANAVPEVLDKPSILEDEGRATLGGEKAHGM